MFLNFKAPNLYHMHVTDAVILHNGTLQSQELLIYQLEHTV